MSFHHLPVMPAECIEGLAVKPDGVYVDCTLGGGGHSEEIAGRLARGVLVGIDRDEEAIRAAGERLARFGETVKLCRSNFNRIGDVLASLGFAGADGILFDLGTSSHQLDSADRGFSYTQEARLDMRMDRSSHPDAAEIVNSFDEQQLARVLWEYGEEKFSKRIAAEIIAARRIKPIETTTELAEIVKKAIPIAAAKKENQHPARRSFQALRLLVNEELPAIESAAGEAIRLLNPGGRLVVLTFHSLEDRIVKNIMKTAEKGCVCPPGLPACVCGKTPTVRILTRKAALPTEDEIRQNPRARSAKLRICEKLMTAKPEKV